LEFIGTKTSTDLAEVNTIDAN